MDTAYRDMAVEEVQEFMRTTREDKYHLIDVRLPEEYTEEHLAGALLIPVGEIEGRISELSPDKDIIVYCMSGKRSAAAAVFIGTHPDITGNVYNMLGGIYEWDGEVVPDMPNIALFDMSGSEEELLYQAMNLEKGAHVFYEKALELFPSAPFTPALRELASAEEAHAKMVYAFWKKLQTDAPKFEDIYEELAGDILEGGQDFETLFSKLQQADLPCMDAVEMAITIEFSAYDLYRNMAQLYKEQPIAKTFLTLCQAEKDHMRIAAEAVSHCY